MDAGTCPFTGLQVGADKLQRRPLAVKVSNAPRVVRPQAGLAFADVVWEHYAEGNLTRFTAVFLCQDVPKIGPIRSGRLIDLEIPAMFRAIFVFSGASDGVNARLTSSDIADRVWSEQLGYPVFRRIPQEGKAFEHTLFSDTATIWAEADRRGLNGPQDVSGWVFSETPPSGGTPVSDLKLVYSDPYAIAQYHYDASVGGWLRYAAGDFYSGGYVITPHKDDLTGKQLAPANVVVLYVPHVNSDILEDTYGGGHWSIEIQVWGEGLARVFRDGKMYTVRWQRPQRHAMLRLVDAAGNPFPLRPGQTFIQVVPTNFRITVQ